MHKINVKEYGVGEYTTPRGLSKADLWQMAKNQNELISTVKKQEKQIEILEDYVKTLIVENRVKEI